MNELDSRRELTLADYLAVLRRRMWWIAVPAVLGPVIAFGISLRLPSKYTSQTLVLVEQQKVPDSYVKPVVASGIDDRLATMQEQILSRAGLQPIIETVKLFDDKSNLSLEDKLDLMRKATKITPLRSETGGAGMKGFYVSFTASDPRIAQQVCRQLTSMFMDENLRLRQTQSRGASEFLLSQLQEAKRNLDEQDDKLAEFKRKYIGQLPGEDQQNFSMLASLNTQLDASTQAVSQLQQSKTYTEALLSAQLQTWESQQSSSGTTSSPDTLDQQLAKDQATLADLLSKYTDTHPDVIRLKNDIEKIKNKLQDQGTQSRTIVPDQKRGPEPAQIQQLRAQLSGIQQAIRDKQRDQARIEQKVQGYQARIQLSPAVEAQYKALTRDHDTALAFYNELQTKRNQSEMAVDLERRQEGEQFRVLDAPNLPEKPTFPNRPMFAAGGFAGGLAIGLGLVFLLEFLNNSIRNERDVLFYLQLPTLTIVPDLESDSAGSKHKLFGWRKSNKAIDLRSA